PGQIFALAPSALAARHALLGAIRCMLGPMFPWVSGESVLSVWCEIFHKLTPDSFGEARADADVLKRAGFVEKTEQQRAESGSRAVLVPSKPCDDTIAIAFVFDLEHYAFVGFVDSRDRLCDYAVQTSTFEATKPVCGY